MKFLGLAVVAVLVAGGAWYLSTASSEAPTVVQDTKEQLAAAGGTLADFLTQNQAVTCKVRNTTDAGVSEGVVYVNGDQVRADFTTEVVAMGGSAIDSHMITDGEWVYTWSGAAPQGMKMKVAAGDEGDSGTSMSGSWEDMYKEGAYDCTPWSVEEDRFVPPQDVTFMELGDLVPQGI